MKNNFAELSLQEMQAVNGGDKARANHPSIGYSKPEDVKRAYQYSYGVFVTAAGAICLPAGVALGTIGAAWSLS